ncbi:MAG TPA: CYTH domain-containing protein [Flavobacteriaceae bacterium]|nr:CYTH domain-containing protein [Flavobacteriaceae bacterium]
MTQEIERKFLVLSEDFKNEAVSHTRIVQGFLNRDPNRTVRVRLKGDKGYLTVKGKTNATGTTRSEWETEISRADATHLLTLCEAGVIEKIRYEIPVGRHCFEVDEFLGENQGLILAEIELQAENETFQKPNWLGNEVTGDVRYYNSQLSLTPYREWNTN